MAIKKTSINLGDSDAARYVLIGALVLAAFFGAYKFASASSARTSAQSAVAATVVSNTSPRTASAGGSTGAAGGGNCCGGAAPGASGASGGGCCGGGGGSNATVQGKTTTSGGVQKVAIDLTGGSYSPNRVVAKAGTPIELDFKGPASGCNGYVVSQQLGFQQDVSNGGTIKIAALQPGTYTWTCSMGMYIGRIVVE